MNISSHEEKENYKHFPVINLWRRESEAVISMMGVAYKANRKIFYHLLVTGNQAHHKSVKLCQTPFISKQIHLRTRGHVMISNAALQIHWTTGKMIHI